MVNKRIFVCGQNIIELFSLNEILRLECGFAVWTVCIRKLLRQDICKGQFVVGVCQSKEKSQLEHRWDFGFELTLEWILLSIAIWADGPQPWMRSGFPKEMRKYSEKAKGNKFYSAGKCASIKNYCHGGFRWYEKLQTWCVHYYFTPTPY